MLPATGLLITFVVLLIGHGSSSTLKCSTNSDCKGDDIKCIAGECVQRRKSCPIVKIAAAPPKGCYYKLQKNDDNNNGCMKSVLKCHESSSSKNLQKRSTPDCPRNSEYMNCTNLCGYPHCATLNHVRPCHSLRCGPAACVCKPGHVFISADHSLGCVAKEDCDKIVHKRHMRQRRYRVFEKRCPPNEHFTSCGSACEPSCGEPNPKLCTMQCLINVCQCDAGYVRHPQKGCIRKYECFESL